MEPPLDAIVEAYVRAAGGDPREGLRLAVSDALADLTEVERRAQRADRLTFRGYARGETVSDSMTTLRDTCIARVMGVPDWG